VSCFLKNGIYVLTAADESRELHTDIRRLDKSLKDLDASAKRLEKQLLSHQSTGENVRTESTYTECQHLTLLLRCRAVF
jgi:hypothetical protein